MMYLFFWRHFFGERALSKTFQLIKYFIRLYVYFSYYLREIYFLSSFFQVEEKCNERWSKNGEIL